MLQFVNTIFTDCVLAPPAPTNGDVTGTSFVEGDTVTYSCNTGFVVTGSTTATCQADGTWDNTATVCNAGIIYILCFYNVHFMFLKGMLEHQNMIFI